MALAVAAGARRTASSYDAILRFVNAADLGADYEYADPADVEARVRAVEGVADVNVIVGFGGFPTGDRPREQLIIFGLWSDPVTVERSVLTAGRAATGPGEATANSAALAVLGVRLGDRAEVAVPDKSFSDLEALQNSAKHTPAAEVIVRLWEEAGGLLFEVADNGPGFDVATQAGTGHGFVNMADRLGAIGGTARWDSAPGEGTRVSGAVPVPAPGSRTHC